MLALLSATASAHAQSGGSGGYQLEEVVVTAQKRAEDVSKVPLAITAVTGETLERQRVDTLQQLRNIDPSVNFRQSTGPHSSSFLIRGVGTSSFSTGVEQSVSTVVDGVVLGDPSSAQDLADVERVEILRGPQGMLFGKNASAGVVSITTRNPELDEFAGRVRASIGEREDQQLQTVLNVPLSSTLAVRLVGGYRHLQESVVNVRNGRPIDPIDIRSARLKLLWRPSDDLKALLSANYSYSRHFCCSPAWSQTTPGYIVAYSNALHGVVASPDNTQAALDYQPIGNAKVYGASLAIEYQLGDYALASITGYQESHRLGVFDGDQHAFNYLSFNGSTNSYRNISQELRIASPIGERFDYVAGLYYYESWLKGIIYQAGYLQSMAPPMTQPTAAATLRSSAKYSVNDSQSVAAFVQANFHLTEQFNLVAGLRFTHDDVTLLYDNATFIPGSLPVSATIRGLRQSIEHDNVSWRFGPQYQLTPDVMLYASVARGYKGPGMSGVTVNTVADNQAVLPEIPTAYEAGMKGKFFDRRLQVGLNLFHAEYKDFQAQVSDISTANFATVIKNAGRLETRGVEVQLQARPTPELTLGFGGAYVDAKYKDFAGVTCYFRQPEPPCAPPPLAPTSATRLFNAKGLGLAGAPKWTYSATADYRRPDLVAGFDGFAAAAWNWQDDVVYSVNGDPGTRQKAFGLLSGEIGIEPQGGPWRFSIWGKNILDERWASQISASPVPSQNPGGYYRWRSPDSFRRVGLQLDVRF
ncbi:MAG: TonB-dependent receptor [Phenylobacterium sp.]|uniref:TonB-dependent receptor n=1 Tax=Phenylobacterium sp. TaxID=1871053 RepID=UPI002733CD2E|nr:TonB-dependent receptor [Phenylobacterium sp.]MDP3747385.1 TonB-dependent receptor [Phenylobacterium sp.]